MSMNYRVSDMELMGKACALLQYEDYLQFRDRYIIRNPRKYVTADTHRRIMEEAIGIAKNITGRGATDDEIRNVCLYLYICVDARKYRLDWRKAKKDLRIDEIVKKYTEETNE